MNALKITSAVFTIARVSARSPQKANNRQNKRKKIKESWRHTDVERSAQNGTNRTRDEWRHRLTDRPLLLTPPPGFQGERLNCPSVPFESNLNLPYYLQ